LVPQSVAVSRLSEGDSRESQNARAGVSHHSWKGFSYGGPMATCDCVDERMVLDEYTVRGRIRRIWHRIRYGVAF
jgi:hypothetical protein